MLTKHSEATPVEAWLSRPETEIVEDYGVMILQQWWMKSKTRFVRVISAARVGWFDRVFGDTCAKQSTRSGILPRQKSPHAASSSVHAQQ